MANPTTEWPKPYLLQVHQAAVDNGLVFVEPITAADAESLKQRLYRARRRSDKAMAAFIPPEFHMVMVGEFQLLDTATGQGRLPIIYDKLPSGEALPAIRAATGEEIEQMVSRPALAEPAPPISPDALLDLENLEVKMEPSEIDGFVGKMLQKVQKESK